ncbi:MAG: hypothetical protein WBF46_13090, partial [Candidatus Acidiferrales bacterium]
GLLHPFFAGLRSRRRGCFIFLSAEGGGHKKKKRNDQYAALTHRPAKKIGEEIPELTRSLRGCI